MPTTYSGIPTPEMTAAHNDCYYRIEADTWFRVVEFTHEDDEEKLAVGYVVSAETGKPLFFLEKEHVVLYLNQHFDAESIYSSNRIAVSPTKRPSCPRWEYMVKILSGLHFDGQDQLVVNNSGLLEALNEHGRHGWELVAVFDGAAGSIAFFKRLA